MGDDYAVTVGYTTDPPEQIGVYVRYKGEDK